MSADPSALEAVLADLRCPQCTPTSGAGQAPDVGLTSVPGGAACPAGHRFDRARHGHLTLLAGRRGPAGDDATMVAARAAVLAAGHYTPLSHALVTACGTALDRPGRPLVVDAGAGTGQHLAAILDQAPCARGLALDSSAAALRHAARVHPRVAAVGADIWAGLPVRDGAADVLLDVFSPRNPAEFARVLAADGVLVVAVPEPGHLAELVGGVGLIGVDPDKDRRLAEQLGTLFVRVATRSVGWTMRLTPAAATTLVAMTPGARHVDADGLGARIAGLGDPVHVTGAVRVEVHTRADPG